MGGVAARHIDQVRAVKDSAHIIFYVVTEGGNSFHKWRLASFDTLPLGRIPACNYVNRLGNLGFHAVTSARLVGSSELRVKARSSQCDKTPRDRGVADAI